MRVSDYPSMVVSFDRGWRDLSGIHPSVWKTFFFLVLPLSAVPPLMLLWAGNHHSQAYGIVASWPRWVAVALTFFLVELATVPLMGWAIQSVAATQNLKADYHDTFLLAAITAVPLWLSPIALAVPSPTLVILASLVGLWASASLLYHGTFALLKLDTHVEALSLAYTVYSLGVGVWLAIGAIVVVPLVIQPI